MKKRNMVIFVLFVMLMVPFTLSAVDSDELVAEGDNSFELRTIDSTHQAIALYEKALEVDPSNYDACYRLARANAMVGELSKREQVDGWKKICETQGRLGMKIAQKAQKMSPERGEAYFYEAWSMGIYADGISVIKAVKEGLGKKVQKNLEKSYNLDKTWKEGNAIMALGKYWMVMPWPVKDKKKSLKYFEEYENLGYIETSQEKELAKLYYTELLLELKGKKYKEKARLFSEDLKKSATPLYREKAENFLKKL